MLVSLMIGSISCKTERNKTTTLVRDCTGTYLRYKEKDYHVCNSEILEKYADGDKMIVTFKKVKECRAREGDIVCMMFHENAGWIEVKEVLNEKK